MVDEALKRAFGNPSGSLSFNVEILDFEPVVENGTGHALFRARVTCKDRYRIFTYKIPVERVDLVLFVDAMEEAVAQFVRDLCRWLEVRHGRILRGS